MRGGLGTIGTASGLTGVSTGPGEGKTTVALGLTAALPRDPRVEPRRDGGAILVFRQTTTAGNDNKETTPCWA